MVKILLSEIVSRVTEVGVRLLTETVVREGSENNTEATSKPSLEVMTDRCSNHAPTNRHFNANLHYGLSKLNE